MRLLCIGLLLLLGACARPQQQAVLPQKLAAAPSSTPLYGGDARAWLGPLGNIEDQSYCHARLKLPLAPKPQWEYGYNSATFSGAWPTSILNYNGTLAVCALSPQLMLMDAASGRVLQNKDVYRRNSAYSQQESFYSTYIAPNGRLVAVDASNALYCFDMQNLTNVWFLRTPRMDQLNSPLVVNGSAVFADWGPGYDWNPHSVGLADGKPGWVYGMSADADGFGATLSRSGILLIYTQPDSLRALRARDGVPLWNAYESAEVALAPIDEQRQWVYSLLYDESVVCRDLKDGALRWRYSWSDVLSDVQREDLMQRAGLRQFTRAPLEVQSTAFCVGDDGSYLSLANGEVIHLSPEGQPLWKVRLDAPVGSLVLFDNALLAFQQYQVPDIQETAKASERQPDDRSDPFNLTRPNWGNLTPVKNVRHARFSRAVALSRSNGAILSSVDTAVTCLSNLCPAGGNLVFGGSRRGDILQAQQHYITAYSWVEQ